MKINRLPFLALCGLAGVAVSATSAFADTYSAVNNFPTVGVATSSQNGVWSYGYETTLNPVNFALDTTSTPDYFGDGTSAGFYTPTSSASYGPYPLPAVLQNVSGGTLNNIVGTIGPWPTDLLLMHPGPDGDYSVIRFTAPTAGTYDVTGEFTAMGNYSGATVDSVDVSGVGSVYSTTSTNGPHLFSFSESLAAGQTIDFAVGLGPAGQFYYDSTGFNATISATPEPGFYGVMALGLAGMIMFIRRRERPIVITISK